jgi:uncharacterized cupredoxin-like copper-binding protein
MRIWLLAVLLAFAATACGSEADHAGDSDVGSDESMGEMDHGGAIPGGPADTAEAEREVTVSASDDLKFDPALIEVSAGEVVTFVIRNEGETEHEFVLGDTAYQQEHEKDMAEGGHHMPEMDNAVTVEPGETAELTWRFDEAGQILFGCHEPGHYDGGMVGTIEVG